MDNDKFIPDGWGVWLIIIAAVCLFLIGWLPLVMWNVEISEKSEDWSYTSTYYSMIISLINTIAVFLLGYRVFISQKKRDNWEKTVYEMNQKPVMKFVYYGSRYRLYNMGNGTAHNIVIGKVPFVDGRDFKNVTFDIGMIEKPTWIGYSVPSKAYLRLEHTVNAHILFAYYEDLPNRYLVRCFMDVNEQLDQSFEIMNYLVANSTRQGDAVQLIM